MLIRDKVALVTGGGKGIGKGICRCLLKEGAKVCINYNTNQALAEQTLRELSPLGECFLYQADVTQEEQARAMVEETVRRFGGLDLLVNNAALQANLDLLEYDEKTFDRVVRVNLGGYLRMMQLCLPYLKMSEREPSIINISSVHGKRATDFDPVYSLTKGCMHMLTREAALEFGTYGVRVNTLLPAGVRIEFKTKFETVKEGSFRFDHSVRPNKPYFFSLRGGLPDDLGNACVFLASDRAAWISGAALRLDGAAILG